MSTSNIPNFFIIGAPKCGTTAMSEYLRSHPQIFMSSPKEPGFLADDIREIHAVDTMHEYLQLFQDSTEQHRAVGEASVWYLYSQPALNNIRKLNPDAKIIVMFRQPVEFLESYHAHMLFSLVEDEVEFERAWSLQDARAKGGNIPKTCRTPMMLQYDQLARFGSHLEKVYQIFPCEQVLCILFDDFISDPRSTYLNALMFLGLKDDGRSDFPILNERKAHRSSMAAALMFAPPRALRILWRGVKKIFGPGVIHHANRLVMLNSGQAERKKIAAPFRRRLHENFKDDIRLLENLIERNLGEWHLKMTEPQRTDHD